MKRCALILPWFGPLRNYFDLFLKSCSNNKEYDWIIYTDHAPLWAPENVKIIPMTFEGFRRAVQSKFSFQIMLEKPYKICDFKPALGYIFEDELAGYEYWGHCDCDMLFGRLAPILEPLFDDRYEKIFSAGHLTLYRNTRDNNRRFMSVDRDGVNMHRIALSSKDVFAFEEAFWARNVNTLFAEQGVAMYETDRSFNVSTAHYSLRRTLFNPISRRWEFQKELPRALWVDPSGVCALYRSREEERVLRYAYVHLQGRLMNMPEGCANHDYVQITPTRFAPIGAPREGSDIPEGLRAEIPSPKALWLVARRAKHVLCKERDPATFDPYLPYL